MARPKKDVITELALAAKDIFEKGGSISDVGVIIGVLGEDSDGWLKDLKKECTSIEEFIDCAKQRSDIALIAAAVKAAMGYDYEEVDQIYERKVIGADATGKPITKVEEGNRTVKTRHSKKNDSLLKFILKNRMPEYFQDAQKIEINKKSVEIKEITAREIETFAGKLLESVKQENK